MSNVIKSRWWWFIAYPDSLPNDWIDILTITGIPFIVSPLHDKDLSNDGTYKKAHYHVIVIFNNPTTYKHVLNNCCLPLNATIPQVILNLSGAICYLTHKGIESKAQYLEDDIQCFNGSHVRFIDEQYTADVYCAIEDVIREKRPYNLLALIDACSHITDAIGLIRSRPYYFSQLLR